MDINVHIGKCICDTRECAWCNRTDIVHARRSAPRKIPLDPSCKREDVGKVTPEIDRWFRQEILPCEHALNRFLHRHLATAADVADVRQDVYVRLHELVRTAGAFPHNPGGMIRTIARNLLIDRSRHAKVVPLDLTADRTADWLDIDPLTPERYADGREQLQRFEAGLRRLPERCEQVVRLRKVEGLSQRECARRLGMSEHSVERHIQQGMRALTDYMRGGEGRVVHRRKRGLRIFAR